MKPEVNTQQNTHNTEYKYNITHQCVSGGDSSYASQPLGASECHLLPSWPTKSGTWTMAIHQLGHHPVFSMWAIYTCH